MCQLAMETPHSLHCQQARRWPSAGDPLTSKNRKPFRLSPRSQSQSQSQAQTAESTGSPPVRSCHLHALLPGGRGLGKEQRLFTHSSGLAKRIKAQEPQAGRTDGLGVGWLTPHEHTVLAAAGAWECHSADPSNLRVGGSFFKERVFKLLI